MARPGGKFPTSPIYTFIIVANKYGNFMRNIKICKFVRNIFIAKCAITLILFENLSIF